MNTADFIQGAIKVAELVRPIAAELPGGAVIVAGINIGEAIAGFVPEEKHAEVEARILAMIKAGFASDVESEFRAAFPQG